MTKKELIEKLSQYPDDMEVCIMDWRQNLNDDAGEGSSHGVHPNFSVDFMSKDEIPEDSKPWVALLFDNEDYTDDGEKVE